ncbi:V-type proton ATPase subunit S1 [Pelobates cultripes]|uniref:V-type proton ATPase subunit S1 n=1 Tax=Pelobates cultripes TaxID=61616 RepID=A0AAD1SFM5_PELCU|nr:V-type proton ATPase subunit S1 [Pelobates cultripes]
MENNRIYLLLAILGILFLSSKKLVSAKLHDSYNSQKPSGEHVVLHYDQPNEHRQFQSYGLYKSGLRQRGGYSIERKDSLAEETVSEKTSYCPINVTENGNTCLLFGFKRILITFKNQTQLDLTDKNTALFNAMDNEKSQCNEENATLSLKFFRTGDMNGLTLRFLLIKSYYKLSVQNWFRLQSIQILVNESVQETFNATRIFAPTSYSYHCDLVSSLQKYEGLLLRNSANGSSRLWDVTFLDFQIQGFTIEDGQFAFAKDCRTYFSPAILMGLVMSLILLLVLAYALHMLIHLKSVDRQYQRKPSTVYFPKTNDNLLEDEREPLRGNLQDFYELQQHEYCKLHMQQCTSVPY